MQKVSRNSTFSVKDLDTPNSHELRRCDDSAIPKETYKEKPKENTYRHIVKFWNHLSLRARSVRMLEVSSAEEKDRRLKASIDRYLQKYSERQIKYAILSYYRFLSSPKDQQRRMFYFWTLHMFLNCDDDNISRFMDWRTVEGTYRCRTGSTEAASCHGPWARPKRVSTGVSRLAHVLVDGARIAGAAPLQSTIRRFA